MFEDVLTKEQLLPERHFQHRISVRIVEFERSSRLLAGHYQYE